MSCRERLLLAAILALTVLSSAQADETNETAKAVGGQPHVLHTDWGYTDGKTGPAMWETMGYSHCGGNLQSPINIDTAKIPVYEYNDLISFKHYDDVAQKVTVRNNGHTLVATFDYGPAEWRPSVSGGQLSGSYEFEQLHFHWGAADGKLVGAEHTIDGVRGPLEMHMVHRNAKYSTMSEAVNNKDGILVLAALFEMNTNEVMPLLSSVESVVELVRPFNSSVSLKPRALASVLPKDTSEFFHYRGSLTTPGCQQSVDWVIFARRSHVIVGQVFMLATLLRENNEKIMFNFRPTQKLNDRKIYHMVYKKPGVVFTKSSAPRKLQATLEIYGIVLVATTYLV